MKWIHPLLLLMSPGRRRRYRIASRVYSTCVAQARLPAFYSELGIPDTMEGRFDLLALHVALVCRRLAALGQDGRALAQALFDTMFLDMELNLREIGISDPSIGRSVKGMAKGFLGRARAYGRALDGGEALEPTLERNLYAGETPSGSVVARMARYVRDGASGLDGMDLNGIATGASCFPTPVSIAQEARDGV